MAQNAAEVAKREQQKQWWAIAARQLFPEEEAKLRKEMVTARNRLFDRFKQLPDGVDLIHTLHRLTDLQFAFAYYPGFRRGYNVARALAKLSRSDAQGRADARIMELILDHSDWTAKHIFGVLNDEEIPLVYLGGIHKQGKKLWKKEWRPNGWLDVINAGAYKTHVSRLRKRIKNISRLQSWEQIMKRHKELRKDRK